LLAAVVAVHLVVVAVVVFVKALTLR